MPRLRFAKLFVENAFEKMSPDMHNKILTNFSAMGQMEEIVAKVCEKTDAVDFMDKPIIIINIGSLCSGSDIFMTYLPLLEKALREHVGLDVQLRHLWSCEYSARKRIWLKANFDVPQLFGDVLTLSSPDGSWNFMTGKYEQPMHIDILIAGFSCRDASRLSGKQQQMRGIVGSEEVSSSTTGSTFKGVAQTIESLKPTLVLLENVPGLMDRPEGGQKSNFDMVAEALREFGYCFAWRIFDAAATGIPHRRMRLWMSAVRRDGDDRAVFEPTLQRKVNQNLDEILKHSVHYPLTDFLLDTTNAMDGDVAQSQNFFKSWWPELGDGKADLAEAARKWPRAHDAKYPDISPEELEAKKELLSNNPHYHSVLTPRQRDLLCRELVRLDQLGTAAVDK